MTKSELWSDANERSRIVSVARGAGALVAGLVAGFVASILLSLVLFVVLLWWAIPTASALLLVGDLVFCYLRRELVRRSSTMRCFLATFAVYPVVVLVFPVFLR